MSNLEYQIDEIYNLYRKRNVVEQAFNNYKNHLGLDRFRVHGDKRMVKKSFLCFISLIIYSYIYKNMLKKSLFTSKMTLNKVLIEFGKIKSFEINGIQHIRPLTACQKKLLTAFDIEIPDTL
jgi:transposase